MTALSVAKLSPEHGSMKPKHDFSFRARLHDGLSGVRLRGADYAPAPHLGRITGDENGNGVVPEMRITFICRNASTFSVSWEKISRQRHAD